MATATTLRTFTLRPNSGCAVTLKDQVTDRAKRYRANQDGCLPSGKKECALCESTRFLTVDHRPVLDLNPLGVVAQTIRSQTTRRITNSGGEEAEKDCVMVGEVYSLTYVTDKQHLGRADKKPGPYEHVMGEKGGVPPFLVYDSINQTVGFSGGTYVIDPTNYDGRHSAGIRN